RGVAGRKRGRLARTRVPAQATVLEPYHDRIREAVAGRLSPAAARACHRALAREMEASGHADPDVLAFHFEAAGETSPAADYARRAADRALESLAFEHAARLYALALRLCPEHPDRRRIRVLLADALANGGRGPEAAPHYLEAAREAQGLEAQELRRRATQQLLTSGHIRAGM